MRCKAIQKSLASHLTDVSEVGNYMSAIPSRSLASSVSIPSRYWWKAHETLPITCTYFRPFRESKEYWWERLLSTWRKSWEHTLSACPLHRTTEIQLVNVFCKALNNTETSGRGNRLLQFAQSISHYLFNSHSHVIFLNCFHSIESMKAPWPRYLSLTLAKSSCLEISRAAWANQMQYCQNHIQLLL